MQRGFVNVATRFGRWRLSAIMRGQSNLCREPKRGPPPGRPERWGIPPSAREILGQLGAVNDDNHALAGC